MINDYEIKLINTIIFEAIKHGGDYGGPYFTNEDGLISAINKLLDIECMTDKYEIQEIDIKDEYRIYLGIHQIERRKNNMAVYTPTKSLAKFIKDIENGRFETSMTCIITGKNGATGKTYLTNFLKNKGFNAFEITCDLLGLISYNDAKNHFIPNLFGDDLMTIVLNEPLIKNTEEE